MIDKLPRFDWYWVRWWTFAFAANLPVPLLLSWGAVLQGGGVGLFGGVALLYLLGATVCGLGWRVGRSLVHGGILVALTQFFPLLQICSGVFALKMWSEVTGSSSITKEVNLERADAWEWVWGNFEVCTVVFLTAQPLMVLAILIGAGFRALRGDTPLWLNRRTDPDTESE